MTSRSGPARGHSDYQIDMLIRCALRERVARTAPSAAVWQRVCTTARRTAGLWGAWNRITYQFEAVGVCLFDADTARASRGEWDSNWASTPLVRYDQHWSRLNRHQVLRLVA